MLGLDKTSCSCSSVQAAGEVAVGDGRDEGMSAMVVAARAGNKIWDGWTGERDSTPLSFCSGGSCTHDRALCTAMDRELTF
jgi:hypothetical protein